ncbi:MAG TPA: OB-fold domain-containing protein [Pseudonocardiaceae bacterium]
MFPIPAVDLRSEFYWTSGADGVLRLQGCEDCGGIVHPPSAACHRCRGSRLVPRPVSGKGTVVAVTVNHQAWQPDLPVPYAIAVVAIAEDPSVRLTARVVGADPESVQIGQQVSVSFERRAEVWIPVVTAVPGEIDAELPVVEETPEQVRLAVRAPATARRYEHASVISGIGNSRLGRRLMVDPLSLAVDACRAAVADAGLTFADIDGLATYPGGGVGNGFSEGGLTAVEEALRLRPVWYAGGAELPGPGGSVVAAMLAVAAGLCRHVLCFRTVWEATYAELLRTGRRRPPAGDPIGGPMTYTAPSGSFSAANTLALGASHYLHRFGASRETLGWIALNARANAALHPDAIYRTPLTMDDYLGARTVSSPFGLYDCDVPCDGSIAVVVSAAETAPDLPHPAIRFEAAGTQIVERVSWDQSTLTHEPQVLGPAMHLWTRTDLRPADVDLALLYDGFTFNCLSWLEALGFCGIGEAPGFLDGGKRIARDGELPLNTHGGQLSHGRTHGFGLLQEAVTQLRHEAGQRQVAGAEVAVVSSGGLTPASALLLVRDR